LNRFWFVIDEVTARINELRRQRARGAVIDERHVDQLDEIAAKLREIVRFYDAET